MKQFGSEQVARISKLGHSHLSGWHRVLCLHAIPSFHHSALRAALRRPEHRGLINAVLIIERRSFHVVHMRRGSGLDAGAALETARRPGASNKAHLSGPRLRRTTSTRRPQDKQTAARKKQMLAE